MRNEMDNLIADLREAMSPPFADEHEAGDAAEIAALTSPWYEARGLWAEAVARLEAAVASAPPGAERASALATLAQHHVLLGDMTGARELAQAVLDDPDAIDNARALALLTIAQPSEPPADGPDPLEEALRLIDEPDSTLAMMVRSRMGQRALAQGDALTAVAILEEVIGHAREHRRTVVWVQALVNVGSALMRMGRLDDAEEKLGEARAAATAERIPQLRAICLTGLSLIALHRGDNARALAFAEERLLLAQQMADVLGQATAHVGIANASLGLGDRTRAKEENRRAHDAFRKLDLLDGSATALFNLALLADGEGDDDEAGRAALELVRMVAPRAQPVMHSLAMFAVGGVAAGRGIERAAELLAAEEVHRPPASSLDPSDQAWLAEKLAALDAAVDADAVAAARARGADLSLESALALADELALELA